MSLNNKNKAEIHRHICTNNHRQKLKNNKTIYPQIKYRWWNNNNKNYNKIAKQIKISVKTKAQS